MIITSVWAGADPGLLDSQLAVHVSNKSDSRLPFHMFTVT